MMKKKNAIFGLSVFALALMMAFMLPRIVVADGLGQDENVNAEISDPDVSEAMEQEVAETAQDVRQGAQDAARKTEQMAETATRETAEFLEETEDVLDRATTFLTETLESKKRIPKSVIENSAGIALFPDVTKAGFIAGGRYGNGILMLNQKNGWNGPIFLSLMGASVGAQIGVEQSDLFMVFNNQEAINDLVDGELTLGAQTSVSAGTWGNKVGASTDADVLVYKRTEGLFAGASLSGAVINVDEDSNLAYFKSQEETGRAYYGTDKMLSGEKEFPKTNKADKVIVILSDWE